MKRRLIKICAVLMAATILLSMLVMSSSAYVAFNSYNYNYYGEAIEVPSGYTPVDVLTGKDLGVPDGVLANAVDIYVSPTEEIYIIDYFGTENEPRLHVINKDFTYKKTYTTFVDKTVDGNPEYKMNLPEGVTVDLHGNIYICDTGNNRVIKVNQNGELIGKFNAPNSELFTGEFKPSKVAIAKNESVYVICNGALDGIMEFNRYGTFLRYFGAPDVQLSLADMVTLAWRRIYRAISGQNADASFITFVPTEFENMVVDEDGFVYAVIAATGETNTDQLMKMNFLGNNILDPTVKSTAKVNSTLSSTFGDLVRRSTSGHGNIFKDVAVDEDGFITMLDTNLCKVFEYDTEGNMTFVYGAKGYQQGLFYKPISMAKLGKKTLVLDNYFGTVTVFDLTYHGRTLHSAINLYDAGLYDQAESYWDEVLKTNANCELAHIGVAKVLYQKGDYEGALDHFKLANDRTNYQDAYSLYRESVLSDNFDFIMTLLVVLILLMVVFKVFGKRIFEAIKNKRKGGGDDDDEIENE